MSPIAATLFDTPVGACAIAWGPAGITALRLPAASPEQTLGALRRRHPRAGEGAPPPPVRQAIDAIVALLHGEPRDLADVVLDMTGVPAFECRVYALARRIGPGRTCTYGELAAQLGDRGLARAVGQALGTNPFPIVVPCHRVLAAGGRSGGFSAPGGVDTKLRLLEIERARIGSEPSLFDAGDPATA